MNKFLDQAVQVSNEPLTQRQLDRIEEMKVAAARALEAGKRRQMSEADRERYAQKMQSAVTY